VTPQDAMRRAIRAGERSAGRSFPNPNVGALLFRGDRILASGSTRPVGGAHAEIVALEAARRRHGARAVRGASMAVTLEPCVHQGRTGPCVDAVIAAGVRRLFVGIRDPHPLVAGRGLRKLRRAGVEVELGVLAQACREHHRGFLSVCERERPFVTLKLASSLDARIATATGESRWITGPESRAAVHRMRARVDAVVVGSETAIADDPELTARRGGRVIHRPVAIVVDSRLRVPIGGNLYRARAPGGGPWLICAKGARGAGPRLDAGAKLIEVPVRKRDRRLDLRRALIAVARAGVTTLLVEGGGGLAAALVRESLVDEIHWMLAPRLIGADGRPALGDLGTERLGDALSLRDVRVVRRGPDLQVSGRVGEWGIGS